MSPRSACGSVRGAMVDIESLQHRTYQNSYDWQILTRNGKAHSLYFLLFNQDGDGDPAKKDKMTDMGTFEAMFAADIDFINEA